MNVLSFIGIPDIVGSVVYFLQMVGLRRRFCLWSCQSFPALSGSDVLEWVIHPGLIERLVITRENWTVVVDFQFPTTRWCVTVRVHVLNLIGGRTFAEIGRSAEKIHTRFLW